MLDERIAQMRAQGVVFETGVVAGKDPTAAALLRDFDRVVLAGGARRARRLELPGGVAPGVHYAMDFLTQQNRRVAGEHEAARAILATGKTVVVLGGGDTGADCVGTAVRQGAKSVLQLELMPQPPLVRAPTNPWPEWPLVLRSSTSHDEGCARDWAVSTRALVAGTDPACGGGVAALEAVRVELHDDGKSRQLRELEGSRFSIPCDSRAPRDGVRRARDGGARDRPRGRPGRTRQRADRRLRTDERPPGVRVRRHEPRPVAGRVGHRRRPARRPRRSREPREMRSGHEPETWPKRTPVDIRRAMKLDRSLPFRVPARLAVPLLLVVGTALLSSVAWGSGAPDPTGAVTGGAGDVPAAVAGQPTLLELATELGHHRAAINMTWAILAAALVMFMQAGFAMVETGLTRAKNAAHTMAMNLVVYGVGMLAFWAVGFALQMGGWGRSAPSWGRTCSTTRCRCRPSATRSGSSARRGSR